MIDLVIAGTGRCGTGWTSALLTKNGVACGHEQVFTIQGINNGRPDLVADASWAAVPFLPLFPGRVIHLVRHPLAVIRSFLGTRHFGPHGSKRFRKPWLAFLTAHWGLPGPDPLEAAMCYYVEWNRSIEPHASGRYRVEDLPNPEFQEAAGLREIRYVPPKTVNAHKHREPGTLPRGPWRDALVEMAAGYGYDTEGL